MGPRIACFGGFTSTNALALSWALVFRAQIEKRLPGASIAWFSCRVAGATENSRLGVVHSPRVAIGKYPEGPDAVVLGGGTTVHTRWSARRGQAPVSPLCPPGTDSWLLPSLLAHEWDVPLLWDALRVGRARTPDDVRLLGLAARLSQHRCVSDPDSARRLTETGEAANVRVAPDLRVLLAQIAPDNLLRRAWQRLLRKSAEPATTLLCEFKDSDLVDDSAFEALRRLRRGQFSRIIVMTCSGRATKRLRQLTGRLGEGVVLIERRLSPLERLALTWGADAWLGSGTAGCWAALAFHKPHLVLGRCPASEGYAAVLGRPDLVVADLAELSSSSELLSARQTPILAEVQARLAQMANDHLDELANVIHASTQDPGVRRTIAWVEQIPELPRCRPLLGEIAPLAARKWLESAARQQTCIARLDKQARKANKHVAMLQQTLDTQFSALRYRVADQVTRWLRRVPLALRCGFWLTRAMLWLRRRLKGMDSSPAGLARYLDRIVFLDPTLGYLFKPDTERALRSYLADEMREICLGVKNVELNRWFADYRPSAGILEAFRSQAWPPDAPLFSVLVRLNASSPVRLTETLHSLTAQTYARWEMRIVMPQTALAADVFDVLSVEAARLPNCFVHESEGAALREARGDYVSLLEHGDALEPHALHRFAQIVATHGPGVLYSDAVAVGDNLDDIHALHARPAFSYDYFLAHGYIGNLLAVRSDLLREAGGLTYTPELDRDTDWLLRVLELQPIVSHVPDILYRQRLREGAADEVARNDARRRTVAAHLGRLDVQAELADTDHAGCLDVRWPAPSFGRTAIIIPTKNHCDLLRTCIDSLHATLAPNSYDLCVVDHESREPASREYLARLGEKHQVVPYQGSFNFSRLMNHGVLRLRRPCDYYLFLNNDVEALSPGWLEHMLGIARRAEVGAVGALLLYPDRTVQHGGAVIGMHMAADHVFKRQPAYAASGRRLPGRDMSLLAARDQTIVTAACLLVRAEVFQAVGGYDPALAVGFGDSDLCLRIRARGLKIILDPQAVLLHHESASRGQASTDPHPLDTQRFRARYLDLIMSGDPSYSPLLSRRFGHELNPYARAKDIVEARTVRMILPSMVADNVPPRILKRAG